MTIVPASSLSRSDMLILGNNVRPAIRRAHTLVAAVNRSLKVHGEAVDKLTPSPTVFEQQDRPAVA